MSNKKIAPQVDFRLVILPFFLSALSAVAIWLWFPDLRSVFIRADSDIPLNIHNTFPNALKIWLPVNLGIDNSRGYPTLFPYTLFWYSLRRVFDDSVVERLWWIFLESIAIFSSTWLCFEVSPARRERFWSTLLAVTSFAFSGYVAISYATGHDTLFLALALAPAMLAATLRYIRSGNYRWIVVAVLVVSFGAYAFTNPPMILSAMVIPEICLLATGAVLYRLSFGRVIKFCAIFVVTFIFVNAWWFLPFVNLTIFGDGAQILIPPSQRLNWPNFTNPIGSRFGLLGIGYWGLFRGVNGHPYFPTAAILWSPVVCVALVLTLCVILVSALRRPKRAALFSLVGLILLTVGLWGAKANNAPLSFLAESAFANVPGLWIFRSAYEKFQGTALIGALFCIPQGYPLLVRFLRFKAGVPRRMAYIITGVCAAALSFPFLSGTLVKANNGPLGYKAFVKVPPEYDALAKEVERLRGGRILVVPGVEYALYRWGAASGDILRHYLPHSYISVLPHYIGASASENLLRELASGSPQFRRLASEAGVRYLLVRNDVDSNDFGYQLAPTSISNMLSGSTEIFHDKYFSLYKISATLPPLIGLENDPFIVPVPFRRTWYGYLAVLPAQGTPTTLVLRNNFNTGWRLAGLKGAHKLGGDFANDWVLGAHKKTAVSIYFIGAVLQLAGGIVTAVTLVGLFALFFVEVIWHVRRHA